MKYMVMVVVLLHLCKADAKAVGAQGAGDKVADAKTNIREIIQNLREIKAALGPEKDFKVPSKDMRINACNCIGTFAKDLKHFVHELDKTILKGSDIVERLKSGAETLSKHHQEKKDDCKSIHNLKSLNSAIDAYIPFLQEIWKNKCSIV